MNEGGRSSSVVEVGIVRAALVDPTSAVFLDVDLVNRTLPDGSPVQARCRLVQPYHGTTWGDWWVPEVGTAMLCVFPGFGPEGEPGSDIDHGYALGVVSGTSSPPVPGVSDLSRIDLGKPFESRTQIIQGIYSRTVELDDFETIVGNKTKTVTGGETSINTGGVVRSFLSNLLHTIVGDFTESMATYNRIVAAAENVSVGASSTHEVAGAFSRIVGGALTWVASGVATLTAPTITLVAASVQIGEGPFFQLIDSRFKALYDSHWHWVPNAGASGTPNAPLDLATMATQQTLAS